MTTLYEHTLRCAICGNETAHTVIGSTYVSGSPDLDTRPPAMQRSTIHTWVQRCLNCGACFASLNQTDACAEDVIQTPEYLAQLNNADFPELANAFLCESMIRERGGDWASATWSLIHAAWTCDDTEHTDQAMHCRKRAAAMLRKAESHDRAVADQPGASTAILIDLLRRANELCEATAVIQDNRETVSNDTIALIMDYQKALIEARDLGCHTIQEAIDANPGHRKTGADHLERHHDHAQPETKRWWQFWK